MDGGVGIRTGLCFVLVLSTASLMRINMGTGTAWATQASWTEKQAICLNYFVDEELGVNWARARSFEDGFLCLFLFCLIFCTPLYPRLFILYYVFHEFLVHVYF